MATHKFGVACLVALAVLGSGQQVKAATLTLAWDHSADSSVAGYQVSYGTQSGKYTTTVKAGYVTSVSMTGLADGTSYYFVVQSYDSSGLLGSPSSEVVGQTTLIQPVAISCPSPVLTSPDGKSMSVTLTPTVSGGVTPITTTCSPSSGSLFPVGTTSFTCSAVDAIQQKASCTSAVVVLSPPPPPLTITCPAIAPVTATGNSGKAIVKFADPVVSGGRAPVTVSCTPKSGSQFNVGTTTVSCQAVDAARQIAACTTTASVLSPESKAPSPAPKDPKK